jgi:hypothetical protein
LIYSIFNQCVEDPALFFNGSQLLAPDLSKKHLATGSWEPFLGVFTGFL